MSVKKEASGRRSVQAEVEVPGTPDEVWQAIATGPGVSSWFVPTEVRDDGAVVSHFGPGMDAVATKTAWEPPHRFAAEGEMGPGAPKLATEWIIEARSGSTCVVRVVHSLFATSDDWDNQLESIEHGWPAFFRILFLYLKHFRAQRCAPFQLMAAAPQPAAEAWNAVAGELGLSGAVLEQHFATSAAGMDTAGVVEGTGDAGHANNLLLRLEKPGPGIAHLFTMTMGGRVFVSVRFYFYGDRAGEVAAESERAWRAWLGGRFTLLG